VFLPYIFLRGDWGGFGHPGHPLATPLNKSLITVFCVSSFHVNSIYHYNTSPNVEFVKSNKSAAVFAACN